eukprot:scaffold3600_cov387-Prasinococcus_capsulatus_cf.AAC.2
MPVTEPAKRPCHLNMRKAARASSSHRRPGARASAIPFSARRRARAGVPPARPSRPASSPTRSRPPHVCARTVQMPLPVLPKCERARARHLCRLLLKPAQAPLTGRRRDPAYSGML